MVQKLTQTVPPGERLDARRREILAAASVLFRSHGFHSTGMRDIAAAAEMTVGNLYYYFENKQDLLAFCQEDAVRRLLHIAEAVQQDTMHDGAAQRLWSLIVGHIRCLNEGVPGSVAHLEVGELEAAARRRIVRLRDRYEAAVRALVEQGVTAGEFAPTDAALAVQAILGAANGTVQWYRPRGRKPLNHIAETFATQLVRGLLQPGASFEPPQDIHVSSNQDLVETATPSGGSV